MVWRVRSWWYWRGFESPGRTADQQETFARTNLAHGDPVGLW